MLAIILMMYFQWEINAQTFSQEKNPERFKGQSHLVKGIERYRLIVKFTPEAINDVAQGKLDFSEKGKASIQERSADFLSSFSYRQVFSYTGEEKSLLKSGKVPTPAKGKFNHYAFRGLVYVPEAEKLDKHSVLRLAAEFEKYDFVEYAALEPIEPIAPPSTPDLTSYQHYKYDQYTGGTNVYGIDAEYAWSIGVAGQGVKIADIEWGFDYDHEDLVSADFIEVLATTNHSYDDHGTAVAGVMFARDNGFGMTGMVHEADAFYGVSEIPYGRVYGISQGLLVLDSGDVFLYEMQTGGQSGNYVPADYNVAVWNITEAASAAGIIVVAAAGNGNENLDDSYYDSYRARGDNGAIIVGAGTKSGRNKASFSTYGSPVHVQGWGDWSVATTGYGDLYNGGTHATYTSTFSGTSSATPIVASAVVAVQSYAKNTLGMILSSVQIRDLLIATGRAQGTGGHIGPLPDIRRAIEFLTDSNYAPLVSLTAPLANATFTAPASITISANASDLDGYITKVEFFQDTVKIGEDTISPYSFTWTGVGEGFYTITAKATDDKNTVSVSGGVNISVTPAIPLCSSYPTWNNSTVYINDTVSHIGVLYRAKWYNIGQNPATNSNTYDVWENLGSCSSGSRTSGQTAFTVLASQEQLLYPNPTSGTIHWSGNVQSAIIYDMLGNKIAEVASGSRQTNLSDQPKGIYIAHIMSDAGSKYVKFVLE